MAARQRWTATGKAFESLTSLVPVSRRESSPVGQIFGWVHLAPPGECQRPLKRLARSIARARSKRAWLARSESPSSCDSNLPLSRLHGMQLRQNALSSESV